jgi:hypothetical protein
MAKQMQWWHTARALRRGQPGSAQRWRASLVISSRVAPLGADALSTTSYTFSAVGAFVATSAAVCSLAMWKAEAECESVSWGLSAAAGADAEARLGRACTQ